jgi:hypothetical protein
MGTLGKIKATVVTAIAALLLSGVGACLPVFAGTAATTEISNIAELTYGNAQSQSSNNETFDVQELTDLELVALDSSPVNVASPSAQLLSFELTHTGNGQQSYELLLSQSNSDDFDLSDLELWLDSDGDGMFDDMVDSLYDPGNLPELGPGEALVIFVPLNVPANQALNDVADISLTATASDLGAEAGNPGGTINGAGEGGTDLVVGTNGGQQTATTQLLVSNSAAIEIDNSVTFQQSFPAGVTPVVLSLTPGTRGAGNDEPAAVHIQNVTNVGFEIAIVEPAGSDGRYETNNAVVSYLAIEPGVHQFPNGDVIEAGTVTTSSLQRGNGVGGAESWTTQALNGSFSANPVLVGLLQTLNNESIFSGAPGNNQQSEVWVTMTSHNVTANNFQTAIERSEVNNQPLLFNLSAETMGYVVMDNGTAGTFKDIANNDIAYESFRTGDNVRGWGNAC